MAKRISRAVQRPGNDKIKRGGGIFKDYGITVGDDDYTEGKPFQKG